jgi:predicted phage tail protein
MTTINLHGVLAKEFGSSFEMKIRKATEVFKAIDANKNNFINRVIDLAREGVHYAVIVNGKDVKTCLELEINNSPETIDIVPAICGAGGKGGAIGLAIAGGIALMFGQFSLAVGLIGLAIMMALQPKPSTPKPPTYFTSGMKESFIFASKANLTQQGTPVPIGYGRLRIGSNVIQTTIKSFPVSNATIGSLQAGNVASSFNANPHKFISREK